MNKIEQPFSLYKLPMVGVGTILVLQLITILGLAFYKDFNFLDFFPFDDGFSFLTFLLGVIFSATALMGFIMMVFHHFKINVVTSRNIVFTIGLMVLFYLIVWGFLGLFIFLINNSIYFLTYESIMELFQWLSLLLLLLFLVPLLTFILLIRVFRRAFDRYEGGRCKVYSSRYWRFTNMLAIFTSYSFLEVIFHLVWTSLVNFSISDTFYEMSWGLILMNMIPSFYMIAYIPMSLYFLILAVKNYPSLTQLHLPSVLIATPILFLASGIISAMGAGIYLWSASGAMALELFSFTLITISLFFVVIGFFVTNEIINACFKKYFR